MYDFVYEVVEDYQITLPKKQHAAWTCHTDIGGRFVMSSNDVQEFESSYCCLCNFPRVGKGLFAETSTFLGGSNSPSRWGNICVSMREMGLLHNLTNGLVYNFTRGRSGMVMGGTTVWIALTC